MSLQQDIFESRSAHSSAGQYARELMSLTTYQKLAMEFRLPTADEVYVLLNMGGEVGELLGCYAKARRDGTTPELMAKARKELGDVLWMCAAVATDMGANLGDVGFENLAKLQSRAANNTISGSGDER